MWHQTLKDQEKNWNTSGAAAQGTLTLQLCGLLRKGKLSHDFRKCPAWLEAPCSTLQTVRKPGGSQVFL